MKVLIVDDDKYVTRGLCRLLRESIPGLETLTADNGVEALAICRTQKFEPDLLITDISMPLMDGIELSRQLRQCCPQCKIMIISGFADFQAARSAIELGALNYMLKPIRHEEMIAYVRMTKERIEQEQSEQIRLCGDQLESLLVDLHNHMLIDAPFERKSRIDRESDGYRIVRIVVKSQVNGSEVDLRGVLQQKMRSRGRTLYLIRATGMQATLLLCDVSAEDEQWLDWLKRSLSDAIQLPVAIGIGQSCDHLRDVHLSYRSAGMAIWRAYLSKGGIVCSDESESYFEGNSLNAVFSLQQDVQRLLDFCMLVPDDQQLSYCIHTFMAQMEEIDCPFSMKRLMCADVVLYLLSSNYYAGLTLSAELRQFLMLDVYAECQDSRQLHSVMDRFVELFSDLLMQTEQTGGNRLILRIRSAIHTDLKNASLTQVADMLNMSPSYISMVFKEKTGKHFKDYLFETRMRRAKQLLRQGTPIGVVAQQLGYEDAEHFSRRFRAHFGLSPTVFRNECINRTH